MRNHEVALRRNKNKATISIHSPWNVGESTLSQFHEYGDLRIRERIALRKVNVKKSNVCL